MDSLGLAGQVALVTGAGRGVGRAVAEALARAGAAVAVVARSGGEIGEVRAGIQSAGGTAIALSVDVTRSAAVAEMSAAITDQLGPVDLLVNNAGAWASIGPIWEADPDEWWSDVEVNLRGTFLCSRAVLPAMVSRRRGRIINMASRAAVTPYPYAIAYSASKAAVLRFTDSLALAVHEYSIGVFAISPGLVRTRLVENLATSELGRRWLPQFHTRGAEEYSPPERAAHLVVTLASGKADRLTGRFIHVSDNLDDMLARADTIERDDLHALRLTR